jgi:hypothetical protein
LLRRADCEWKMLRERFEAASNDGMNGAESETLIRSVMLKSGFSERRTTIVFLVFCGMRLLCTSTQPDKGEIPAIAHQRPSDLPGVANRG